MKKATRPEPGLGSPAACSGAEHLARVLAELSRPEAYPGEVGPVEIRQTHISCVFLVGDSAYKVKKPVDFGFLDYRDLDQREAFCRREVALNARLSPEIYLDVLPVVEAEGHLVLGTPNDARKVVEWTVHMRRLPDEWMLAERLPALGAPVARQLARTIAAFHARSETSPAIQRYGDLPLLRANFEENLAVMSGMREKVLPPEALCRIRRFAAAFLDTGADLFRRRMAGGRVRDGHGDLRIRNICLEPGVQGGVQIFDCIEFNDRFRYEDVAADLAYLAMDFDLAGRRDLREVLVAAYERESGDADLRDVLPYYLCYRACVLGKIASLASEEGEIAPDERQAHLEMAAAAFDLAVSYAVSSEAHGELWITVGYSGSGKSRLAQELARRIPAVLLSSDRVRKELAAISEEARLSEEAYRVERRHMVYAELFRRAEPLLRQGIPVILDATFLDPEERTRAAELARSTGSRFLPIVCRCDDAVIRRRLTARTSDNASASDADLAVYEAQRARWSLPEGTEETRMEVDTSRPPAEVAREALTGSRSSPPAGCARESGRRGCGRVRHN